MSGRSGPIRAVGDANAEIIRCLCSEDPNLLEADGALHVWLVAEVSTLSLKQVEAVIAAGWNPRLPANIWWCQNVTALHLAARDERLDLIPVLIQAGACLDVIDETFHSTPMGWAQYFGKRPAVELLGSYEVNEGQK